MNISLASANTTYAENLEGRLLASGWLVESRVSNNGLSGGYNSVGYIVSRKGEKGFLKAYDIQAILKKAQEALEDSEKQELNSAEQIQAIATAYIFERDILNYCQRMDRVVNILDSGEEFIDANDLSSWVPYIICELAHCDIRTSLAQLDRYDIVWRLQTLHHIATGMMQLHSKDVVHHDIKPHNILVTSTCRKLGDLGSGSRRGSPGPNDEKPFPGDIRYAAPEVYYGFTDPDWIRRRIPVDFFALGNIASYIFTQLSLCKLMMSKHLAKSHRPPFYGGTWSGTFEEVKPYLIDAFAKSLLEIRAALPQPPPGTRDYRDDLMEVIASLSHPVPEMRGYRESDGQPSLKLNRLVTKLDLLTNNAKLRIKRGV